MLGFWFMEELRPVEADIPLVEEGEVGEIIMLGGRQKIGLGDASKITQTLSM